VLLPKHKPRLQSKSQPSAVQDLPLPITTSVQEPSVHSAISHKSGGGAGQSATVWHCGEGVGGGVGGVGVGGVGSGVGDRVEEHW